MQPLPTRARCLGWPAPGGLRRIQRCPWPRGVQCGAQGASGGVRLAPLPRHLQGHSGRAGTKSRFLASRVREKAPSFLPCGRRRPTTGPPQAVGALGDALRSWCLLASRHHLQLEASQSLGDTAGRRLPCTPCRIFQVVRCVRNLDCRVPRTRPQSGTSPNIIRNRQWLFLSEDFLAPSQHSCWL